MIKFVVQFGDCVESDSHYGKPSLFDLVKVELMKVEEDFRIPCIRKVENITQYL